MSKIFREGQNWVIVDHINDLSLANEVCDDVTDTDWHQYTTAKGPKSRQHYLMNPRWMPVEDHREPARLDELKARWKHIVQNQVVNHGLMPADWTELHPCSSWTVIGEEGSYHTIHEHGVSNICSVTYLKVPKGQEPPAGQIFFVMHGEPYSPLATPQARIFHIQPHEGMIVIFPSWMLHGVYPQGPGTRQTLNIDFNGDPNYNFRHKQAGGIGFNTY